MHTWDICSWTTICRLAFGYIDYCYNKKCHWFFACLNYRTRQKQISSHDTAADEEYLRRDGPQIYCTVLYASDNIGLLSSGGVRGVWDPLQFRWMLNGDVTWLHEVWCKFYLQIASLCQHCRLQRKGGDFSKTYKSCHTFSAPPCLLHSCNDEQSTL